MSIQFADAYIEAEYKNINRTTMLDAIRACKRKVTKATVIIAVVVLCVRLLCGWHLSSTPSTNVDRRKTTETPGELRIEEEHNRGAIDAGPKGYQNPECSEKRNVALVKVHKAGSSTILNIVQRFGETRNLTFALPKKGNILSYFKQLQADKIIAAPPGKKYDILVHHAVYNYTTFKEIMAPGTVFIATLREPFAAFESSMNYFRTMLKLPGPDQVGLFLHNREVYKNITRAGSVVDNRMAYDLGLDPIYFRNEAAIQEYIRKIDKEFLFIILLEYFDECLVLLKRYMCWSTKDILYKMKNKLGRPTAEDPAFSKANRDEFANWAKAEILIYEYFYAELWRRLKTQEDDFFHEVRWFKGVLQEVRTFCQRIQKIAVKHKTMSHDINQGNGNGEVLVFEETPFNVMFNVSSYDCVLLQLQEIPFLNVTMKRQEGRYAEGPF